mmetsp:Transcript_32724/g.77122  ORF Transcript_32724/g.77122 Transcript_32724/m.77122 type:complete len:242 (+) Transcript_32724:1021-1746(+)
MPHGLSPSRYCLRSVVRAMHHLGVCVFRSVLHGRRRNRTEFRGQSELSVMASLDRRRGHLAPLCAVLLAAQVPDSGPRATDHRRRRGRVPTRVVPDARGRSLQAGAGGSGCARRAHAVKDARKAPQTVLRGRELQGLDDPGEGDVCARQQREQQPALSAARGPRGWRASVGVWCGTCDPHGGARPGGRGGDAAAGLGEPRGGRRGRARRGRRGSERERCRVHTSRLWADPTRGSVAADGES